MDNYLTYLYLLTPLHTGGSANEGNLMGIAREVHTEFPYMPASSVRGKVRSVLEKDSKDNPQESAATSLVFGRRIEDGNQPTEGEIWFADATLLFFPIASLSHHMIWITCPLWLERWSRWLAPNSQANVRSLIHTCRQHLSKDGRKSAVVSFEREKLYLQTALLQPAELASENFEIISPELTGLLEASGLVNLLPERLIVLPEAECLSLVETGLLREVRVRLETGSKTVDKGSFRSEEAIPPETVLFFPWGMKRSQAVAIDKDEKDIDKARAEAEQTQAAKDMLRNIIPDRMSTRLQFGGLEGLGRGWAEMKSMQITAEEGSR
ncbi:type III-B CRISPR module RAMP protein Cmr4 [Nodosilinea sp. P-1105]|uniref:type III-B CRISPR module RAMP protein Cmr4 n=1 Tax=Nodosilinea sp. P-1105 TaxID=2546229 RepID=UPI00146DC0E6|nr:type III-B CRISPR module RAMP protein Cmr4 [Nodosilinea sp. P-1105]NMF86678.1 type III-B CRISPR module RAMP protein Cmr4 [Nodosilinea sp. P-1105]